MIGRSISHYKILDKLGEGGMGVVYRAHDTSLDRDVALKFLPAHLSASDQDKARFIQEAKAAATLNHPNICTIHSIEEYEGQLFIAMQFVDGQLLRDRMSGLQMRQSMEIGIQVAEGLAAAHDKGIVHRDIKPENIMVRKDGIVQIMDFGLAKLKGVSRLTKEGSTVGTAGYMSPEQIQGQEADHRSDIFSLGVLLYEMFTGQLPFKGVHETAIAYEIVNVDATPMSVVKQDMNPDLDRIVLECLEKEPSERFQSAAEVAKELKRYKRESSRQRTTRTIAARQFQKPAVSELAVEQPAAASRTRYLWPALSLVLGLALLASLFFRSGEQADPLPAMTFPINLPSRSPLVLGAATVTIAPDGKTIAYLAADQGTGNSALTSLAAKLYLRSMNNLTPRPLVGSEGASDPFFSADGQWVAFFASGKLKKISIFGGAAQDICSVDGTVRGGWWGEGNNIWYGHLNSVIHRVPAEGGVPVAATTMDTTRGEISHRFPQILPGGQWVLFTVKYNNISSFDEAVIAAENVETHERKELVRGGSFARYVPTGHIMYARGSAIYAVPFDLGRMEVTGPPLPVLDGGMLNPLSGSASFEFSRNGILIYSPVGSESGIATTPGWMERNGKVDPLLTDNRPYDDLRLSPDNRSLAMTIRAANDDVWIYDFDRGTFTRMTFGGGNSGLPDWTPDGTTVVFNSERGNQTGLFLKARDGTGEIRRIGSGEVGGVFRSDFLRDGKTIIYSLKGDLWEVPTDGQVEGKPVLQTPSFEDAPRISPDGRLLAYLSDESGRNEIYVVPFPGLKGKWQISSEGASAAPIWSPDGSELFYAEMGFLVKVDVYRDPAITFSRPQRVCALPPSLFGLYDISRDGKRFLVTVTPQSRVESLTQLNVIVRWFDELDLKFSSLKQ